MSLIEDAAAVTDRRWRPGACYLRQALIDMPPDDAAELRQAIWDPKHATPNTLTWLSAPAISAALHQRGYRISDQMIARHRRGQCSCGEGLS